MEYYTAAKNNNNIIKCACKLMKKIILSEVNKTKKDKYSMYSLYVNIRH